MNKSNTIKYILYGAAALCSNSVYALDCVDSSDEAIGSFSSINIDENTGVVKLFDNYSQELLPRPKIVEGAGEKNEYNFNQEFNGRKKGMRLFKLFYIDAWDEWRLIDTVLLENSNTLYLVGVSGSEKYDCSK